MNKRKKGGAGNPPKVKQQKVIFRTMIAKMMMSSMLKSPSNA
jgi:hypothetical protein